MPRFSHRRPPASLGTESCSPAPDLGFFRGMPDTEAELLSGAIHAALILAEEGRKNEGYAVLLYAAHDAQEAAEGEEWAPVLAARWALALDRFGERLPVGRA